MIMKILITGINGFVGKHVSAECLNRGYEVVGLGRDKKCHTKITHYYSGSVLDKQLVQKAMKDVDAVIHLAALTSHADIIDNKFATLELNLLGTKNVLDTFRASKTAKKFFYASTGKVYGKITQLPLSEEHPTSPLNILGKSKLITEKLIDFYSNNEKEFIIFRIFNVYGPGQKDNFLIPTILEQIKKKKKEIVLGDIAANRDYVYIDDVVNAFILALEKQEKVGISIYNICTGVGTSAASIVSLFNKLLGKNIAIKTRKSLMRHDEMNEEYGSYALCEKELRWKPKVTLAKGLTKLLQ